MLQFFPKTEFKGIVMYSEPKLQNELSAQKYSTDLVERIKSRYQEFRKLSPDPECQLNSYENWLRYKDERTRFCKNIYLETKYFFEAHQDDLSPTDKLVVLKEYIQLWEDVNGCLDIELTDFAEQYKGVKFGKDKISYNNSNPMLAGFNLKNIAFGDFYGNSLMFLAVDFTGADFTKTKMLLNSFNDCNFTHCNLTGANLCHTRFIKCNFEGVDLSKTHLWEASFDECIMHQTIKNKKDRNFRNKCFTDNLFTAIMSGKLNEAVRLITTFPALVHTRCEGGDTPLHLAVRMGQVEVIEHLLKNGARIDVENYSGQKPFCDILRHVPPYRDQYPLELFERILNLFIHAGLDLNNTAHRSRYYLENLALAGSLEALKILVAYGADINVQDRSGWTVLHHLAAFKDRFENKQDEVVTWLLSIGADKNRTTTGGKTALDFAKYFEHREMVNLLRDPPYPFFLEHLKVKPRKLTAETVAHSLWLSDKDAKTTTASKSEFGFWASKQDLHFTQDDIEQCLTSYVMKN
ncbi:ankyrin repeat domain-containing protein [Legionella bononiensis]|uniref:Ankyrin repeat domain-containing protein n=1 Tax=Legionella bononiensis TaxID=2793102 RepID=A0ABS1WFM8_9GAMM|nr:ankyrin repeat domain-containing protein [Legionella bononiensis]MBL7481604.1 ankyrin repeat domain-containing protein [Legionella bononiensis]MBL7528151.1 ankyrin repeat domain-containing protein [Legionella bononiensis]MBL7562627.1 ankyrin repeat domain-containing protein [Legionella bononiensis]